MGQHQQFAPGMRLEIRDAEWRLTRLDHSSDGGYLLGCTWLSELVRGREAQFLSRLEDDIRILDPATTELVDDLSQGYRADLLNLATQLRDTTPTDERIHLGHHAAMDALPFQLEPTRQALGQPRARILIADAVGAEQDPGGRHPRKRPAPGARRPGAGHDPRRAQDHLPRTVLGDAPVRGRHLVRRSRPHRLHPAKALSASACPARPTRRSWEPDRTEYGIALGWEEIKHMKEGVVRKTYLDDTLPDGPWETTIEYHAPFTRPDREKDDEEAWAYFDKKDEKEFGQMARYQRPEGVGITCSQKLLNSNARNKGKTL